MARSRNGANRSTSGELNERRLGGHPVERPRSRLRLEQADEQAITLGTEVAVAVGVLDHRQVPVDPVHGFGDQVIVLGRLQRHIDSCQSAKLASPHAATIDDVLGLDGPLVGDHAGHPSSSMVTPVAGTPSTIVTPPVRAPRASDIATPTGSARPSSAT